MKKLITSVTLFYFTVLLICNTSEIRAQEYIPESLTRDTIIAAALDIMTNTEYCALVTMDENDLPQSRTMNPYPETSDMVIWFATRRTSRKVQHIKNNPVVSIYYADHNDAVGYVNISGIAEVIDDKELLVKKKREYWEKYTTDWKDTFVLIKVTPKQLNIIHYKYGINSDPETIRTPTITF